jgi:uncharacterized protein
MRPRTLLFILAALILLLFIVLSLVDGLLVDFLWFHSLGFGQIFDITLTAQVVIFAGVWLVSFIAIGASGLLALGLSRDHERLHVVRRGDQVTEVNLPELIRSLGDRIPWRLIMVAVAAVLGLFVASSEASSWDVYLRALHGVPFGVKEPAFGVDVGFFVFTLPLLEELRDLFLTILVLTAIVSGGVYWLRGALDFREAPPQISRACAVHLSVLLGAFFVQRALGYWLARYALTLHTNGVVFGLRYIDQVLWKPGLLLLVVLALVAAAICLANVREGGTRLPVAAAVVVFAPSIVLNLLAPTIERLWVKPDELRIETPYLSRNIRMTRQAYQLDSVDVRPFQGGGHLTAASLAQDSPTIDNIRLWDPRPLIATYQQLQEIRLYYNFLDVDIDRYWLNHDETQVMLAARELNLDLLPANAQTWVNRHLKFTHGYGLVMSPVNTTDVEGLPLLFIKNIPPESSIGVKVTRPGIYFGQSPDVYALVNAATKEFDFPQGSTNVFSFYQGTGGVPVSGLWRRMLFSFYYRDTNLLLTQNIIPGSQLLFRRNISDRIGIIAPFLVQDPDPYLVIHNGGLYWIIDCYTVSDHYPYSQRSREEQINYIRNSVKVVVDAYTGETSFYVANPADPVIRTWEAIYPGAFKPITEMPRDLYAHIRYPELFFLIQAEIYGTYHMTDPVVFYNREDVWSFPRENYAGETLPMQPYYVIMRLPGEQKAEYILMLPMVPQNRDNMIAWMAARCDGADYGHLFEFEFSKDRLFFGPFQIQARLNQNPEISQQYSLWNQIGSKVLLGNMLVIPIQDSLLYVEPLYIRAENGQLPELQRVLASYSDRTVMGNNLEATLDALFKGATPPAPLVAESNANAADHSASTPAPGVAQTAAEHYNRALNALKTGDWTLFGNEMQALGNDLARPPNASGH